LRVPGGAMTVVVAALLGVVAGFVAVGLAPVGWILAALLSALLTVAWVRRRLLSLGTYFAFLGAAGFALLMANVTGSQLCSGDTGGSVQGSGGCDPNSQVCASICYAPSTTTAIVIFAAILILGLALLLYRTVRSRQVTRKQPPAASGS